jgi:hypothetical protein
MELQEAVTTFIEAKMAKLRLLRRNKSQSLTLLPKSSCQFFEPPNHFSMSETQLTKMCSLSSSAVPHLPWHSSVMSPDYVMWAHFMLFVHLTLLNAGGTTFIFLIFLPPTLQASGQVFEDMLAQNWRLLQKSFNVMNTMQRWEYMLHFIHWAFMHSWRAI